jgi:hypothetical protein
MARYSPGALALMAGGVTGASVAAALDTSPQTITRWLRGEGTPPEALYTVVAVLGGHDLAQHVRRLVEDAKADQRQTVAW